MFLVLLFCSNLCMANIDNVVDSVMRAIFPKFVSHLEEEIESIKRTKKHIAQIQGEEFFLRLINKNTYDVYSCKSLLSYSNPQNKIDSKEYIEAKTFHKKFNKILTHTLVDEYLDSIILIKASENLDDLNLKKLTQIQIENQKKIQSMLK